MPRTTLPLTFIWVGALLSVLPAGPGFAAGEFRDALIISIADGYASKTVELTGTAPPRALVEAEATCVADLMLEPFSPDEVAMFDTALRTKADLPQPLGNKFHKRFFEVIGMMSECHTLPTPAPASD